MNRLVLGVLLLLTVANSAGLGWLASQSVVQERRVQMVSGACLAEMDKVWDTVSQFCTELEYVARQAQYPSDNEKRAMADRVLQRRMNLAYLRAEYLDAKQNPSMHNVAYFVWVAESEMDVPDFSVGLGARRSEYGNTSKLEALRAQYYILASEVLGDVKRSDLK